MRKKLIILLTIITFLFIFCFLTFAEGDENSTETPQETEQSQEDNTTQDDDQAKEPRCCICGRPYYTADENGHIKYECKGCGNIISNCTCKCWCGSNIIKKTLDDGTVISICEKCGQTCENCTCGNKEAILNFEEMQRNKLISEAGTPKPLNIWPTISAFIIISLVFIFFVVYYAIGKKAEEEQKQEIQSSSNNQTSPKRKSILLKNINKPEKKNKPDAKNIEKTDNNKTYAGIDMFDITNKIIYKKRNKKTASPYITYIMHYISDSGRAVISIKEGAHGKRLLDLINIQQSDKQIDFKELEEKGLFENGFFENAEKSFYEYAEEHITPSKLIDLKSSAFNSEIKIGNAQNTAKQWADNLFDEYYSSLDCDYKYGDRFCNKKDGEEK